MKIIFVDQRLNFVEVQSKALHNFAGNCIVLPHTGELTLVSMREKASEFYFENFDEENFVKNYHQQIPEDCDYQFEVICVVNSSDKKLARSLKRNGFLYKTANTLFPEKRREGGRSSTAEKKTSKGSSGFYRPSYSFGF